MTRTRRTLRLSPLAFALAFGAYCENPFPTGRTASALDVATSSANDAPASGTQSA